MSKLPKGWIESPISEINEYVSSGINPSKYPLETFELFSVPVFPEKSAEIIQGVDIGSNKQLVTEGDVLLCKINPRINRVWTVSKPKQFRQIASSEWITVRSKYCESNFLRYYFTSEAFRELLCSDVSGVGGSLTRAKPKLVSKYKVTLAPLNEQKRIVEKLDDVLAQVDAIKGRLDSIPNIIKRFRQSVLASAVSGKLTEEWRKLNLMSLLSINELEELNTAQRKKQIIGRLQKAKLLEGLPSIELPKFWNWCSIDLCALKITDGTHHSPESHAEGDYMYVTSKNVREGYIDLSKITYVSKDTHDEIFSRCDVAYGDVLYVKDGANTGLACVNNINEQISLLSSVGVIKVANYLLPKYLQHYLNSPIGRKLMLDKMGGTAIKRLTLKKIKESPLSLPPIEEQTEIVRLVDEYFALADTIEAQVNKARARVDSLTQSILAKAFRGELVPQDDSDEPADKLLERIAQAKAEAEALAKAAKKAETAKKRAAKKASA